MSPCALQVRGRVSLKHTVRGAELESPQPDSRPLGELGQRAAMVLRFHSSTIAERNVLHWCIMCTLSLISHTICASPRVSMLACLDAVRARASFHKPPSANSSARLQCDTLALPLALVVSTRDGHVLMTTEIRNLIQRMADYETWG